MKSLGFHRTCRVAALTSAFALAFVLVWTDSGRNVVAWVCRQSAETLTDATHIRALSLDRLDPTCPQCI